MTRYHPALVALHWITGLMVIGLLIAGIAVLESMPNSNPEKVQLLAYHMAGGMIVLVLMLARIVLRRRTRAPLPADTGNPLLNQAGRLAHIALYVLVIGMSLSGLAFSRMAGLPDIVFGGSGAPLPENFDAYWPRAIHGLFALLLQVLILLHILAALWHQFIRKDGLMSRMTFGKRT